MNKKVFIGGKAIELTTEVEFEKELNDLMTGRLKQDVQTTVTISGNMVSIMIPVGLKDWSNVNPGIIPVEIVWLLIDLSLPPHFSGINGYVDMNEFAKLYKEEAKSVKASKMKDVYVSITTVGVVLTVKF